MNLLSLSLDTSMLDLNGKVFSRQKQYASFFDKYVVLVFSSFQNANIESDNLIIYAIKKTTYLLQVIKSLVLILQHHQNQPFDLVTTQDPLNTGLFGLMIKKIFGITLNVQVHNDIFSKEYSPLMQLIAKHVLINADSIRCVSRKVKISIESRLGSKTPWIFLAPISIDLELFKKPTRYKPVVTKFITVSRLVLEKNTQLIIKAFKLAHKQNSNLSLTIIGDGPCRSMLEQQSEVHNHNNSQNKTTNYEPRTSNLEPITFLGHLPPEQVAKQLAIHDVFILTSKSEGYGMVFAEAFASGLSVITTKVASMGEILQPNQNCLQLKTLKPDELSESMLHLSTNPAENYRLAKNGQAYVKNHLEDKVLIKKWIEGLKNTKVTSKR